jgi:hypothetical protein
MGRKFMEHFLLKSQQKTGLAWKDIDLFMSPEYVIYRIELNLHTGG